MAVNPTTSAASEGVITTATVCEAVNSLPEDVRRLMARALRVRSPIYPWTMSHDGRLECRY
jgi:hypothetical protein